MLYAIARDLDAALKAQHVPFPVVFGPESSTEVAGNRERIVIEHRGRNGDSFGPPTAVHGNPKMLFSREQGGTLRIVARSNVAGAAWHDHTERAERVLDHVLAQLDDIVRGRKNRLTLGGGGFVVPEDETGTTTQGRAVYELEFSVDRGVFRRTWEGDKRPEATVGPGGVTITSTTKASNKLGEAGTPPNDAETSC